MKNLIICVDMQNDFMNKDGALYVNGSEEIKPNIKNFLSKLNDDNYEGEIWFTYDSHLEDDEELSDTPDFITTFPKHCMRSTRGQELINEAFSFKIYETKTVTFPKNKFSIFEGSKQFVTILECAEYVENIYVGGVAGDICVKALIDGLIKKKGDNFNFNKLYIIEDCIASLNKNGFEDYITEIILKYDYVKPITSDQIIFE